MLVLINKTVAIHTHIEKTYNCEYWIRTSAHGTRTRSLTAWLIRIKHNTVATGVKPIFYTTVNGVEKIRTSEP